MPAAALRKSTIAAVIAICIAGIAVLALAAPGVRRLALGWNGEDAATKAWEHELADSRFAAVFDPEGHDTLVFALSHGPDELLNGRHTVQQLSPVLATDAHETAVQHVRIAAIVGLAMLLVGNLACFALWRRDSRSDLWHLAALPVSLSLLVAGYALVKSLTVGITLLALCATSLSIVGREWLTAWRLRGPDEL